MIATGFNYRYAALDEVATSSEWLSDHEQAAVSRLRDDHRRHAWLAGRLLAKQLLIKRFKQDETNELPSLSELEIHSIDATGRHVRPYAISRGELLPWSLSISHSQRGVLVAIAPAGSCVGVDLVSTQARLSRGFVEMWFTSDECRWLAERLDYSPATLWGAKEATYKAVNRGERFVPRELHVSPRDAGELSCRSKHHQADCRVTIWRTPQSEFALLATCPHIPSTCN